MGAFKQTQEAASAASLPAAPAKPENVPVDSAGALPGNLDATMPIIVALWAKNGRDTLQIRIDRYQGNTVVDLRNWYPADDGSLKPGKGLTIGIKHLPALAAGIAAALDIARRDGLVDSSK